MNTLSLPNHDQPLFTQRLSETQVLMPQQREGTEKKPIW
jgi:hypothetical protein